MLGFEQVLRRFIAQGGADGTIVPGRRGALPSASASGMVDFGGNHSAFGGGTMRFIAMLFVGLVLVAGAVRAQEAGAGWLGVEIADLTKEEANKLGWEAPRGAKVVKPVPGGPAEVAGLQAGDVLVTLDRVEIENVKTFIAAVSKKAAGTEIRLSIRRAGREKRLAVTLAARPAQFAVAKPKAAEDAPIPMLDTGGHMALIRDIAFTPDGGQIVSASEDKVIRVWDVASGKTVRTFRGEAAPGSAGKVYAMALSPDGKWLAAGGWLPGAREDSDAIRLYDFASGRLVALLKGHENVVYGLAFSPDGRHLISGCADNTAIIWDVETKRLKHRLKGHRAEIYAVGFTADGARAVTGSLDHDLRLWSAASGALLATMTGHGDKVRSLAVDRQGRIASGDVSGKIRLWDGRTGKALKTFARQRGSGRALSFSKDGKWLLSGAAASVGPWPLHVYDTASGTETVTYRGHDNIVIATAISPDGRWAATGGGDNNEIHIWDLKTGERRLGADGQPLTLGGSGRQVWAVGVSADGRRIGWGNTWTSHTTLARNPLEYALTLPAGDAPLTEPVAAGDGAFLRARAELNGWSLDHRKGGHYGGDAILDIKLGGRVVKSIERGPTDGYQHRSYSFTPDGETIISGGSNGWLTAYDRAGNTLGDFTGHEGDVWAVTPSPDGRYLVSGADDQTLRLWNLKTRELLVTLFRGTDGEWVMWTPQGYYAASGPGAELIGWQINRGPENAADYVTAAQLRSRLNRPDIVAKAIQLASAEEAVKQSPHTGFRLSDLLTQPVPRFRIVAPAANTTLTGGSAQLEIALEDTPVSVKLIRLQVNGVQIAEHQPASGPGFKPGTLKFPVPLAKGRNTIRVVAVNQDNLETPAEIMVTHDGEGALDKRGTLYILAIGVDKYPQLGRSCLALDGSTKIACDLRVAGADARSFAETMKARLGPLHDRVESLVLVNGGRRGEPTQDNILDALGMLRKATENDTVVMFVSGHGMNEGLVYNFLATEAAWGAGGLRISTVVPWTQFQQALAGAKGRRILFLDTCHAGNRYDDRLFGETYQANIIVYAAARWDQEALERADLGHGLFTYAIVEGVKGKAKNPAGEVRTEGLRDYLKDRVSELARAMKRQQMPQYYRGRDAGNYLLSQAK